MPISSKSGKQQERVSAVKIVKFFSLAGRFYGTSVANRAPKYETTNPLKIQHSLALGRRWDPTKIFDDSQLRSLRVGVT